MRPLMQGSHLLFVSFLVTAGCATAPADSAPVTEAPAPTVSAADEALLERAQTMFAALPSEAPNPANPNSEARRELGHMLFFDRRLSKDGDVACNDCHRLDRFGVDGEPTSPGHGGQRGDRNSPTVLNAALHDKQFWDGRAADVEEQAKGPILNPIEMALPDAAAVEAVLRSIPGYGEPFRAAFPDDRDPITFDNVALAIGAFERTLLTPGRFDAYLGGDVLALDERERRGLSVFMASGCASCHDGALLGGVAFEKYGAVKPWPTEDPGRFTVTQDENDRFVFKVPSLRNVAQTGPWFHDGAVTQLPDVVRQMADHQLGVTLGAAQLADLVAFLGALEGSIDPALASAPKLP